MEKQIEKNAADAPACGNSVEKSGKESYTAPQAEVIEVCVEQGFAITNPGFGDGGDI